MAEKRGIFLTRILVSCVTSIIVLTLVVASAFSQKQPSRANLESKQKKINNQILYNKKLLQQARESKATSLNELALINSQIDSRKQLIFTIKSEIQYYNQQIVDNENKIEMLENDITDLKEEYSKLIYLSYKMRNPNDKLLYLFAVENIKQAWFRVKYFKQLAQSRNNKFVDLDNSKKQILSTNNLIRQQIEDKLSLSNYKELESDKLSKEQSVKNESIKNILKEEFSIITKITRQQKEAQQLTKQIQEIINKEIAKSSATKTNTSENSNKLNAAEIKLSASFEKNKGKLPWPTNRGTISSTFGKHKHPDFNIYTQNNGIDILTIAGSTAISVFQGQVSEVIKLPSYYAVLVKHGEYFTLYSKLKEVWVKKGDKLKTGQVVGLIRTEDGETEIHFELWHQKQKQNPQKWLRKT